MGLIKIPNSCPEIMNHINQRLEVLLQNGDLVLPDFSQTESILSVSDYAGEDAKKTGKKSDTYQALSFMVIDKSNATMWGLARLALRIKKLDFIRSMEFKKLNKDKERLRLLSEFLTAFDSINGIIITFLIHNKIRYLFTEKSPHTVLAENGYGNWKPHIAEKILRICHLQALFIFKLTSSNHKFLWLTDQDSITEDMDSLGKILRSVFNTYATHGFRLFSYAKPFDDPTKEIDDLLAIPDLVGGAVLEFVHESEKAEREQKNGFEIQEKSNEVLEWFSNRKSLLKKVTCKIWPNPCGDGKFIGFGAFEKK